MVQVSSSTTPSTSSALPEDSPSPQELFVEKATQLLLEKINLLCSLKMDDYYHLAQLMLSKQHLPNSKLCEIALESRLSLPTTDTADIQSFFKDQFKTETNGNQLIDLTTTIIKTFPNADNQFQLLQTLKPKTGDDIFDWIQWELNEFIGDPKSGLPELAPPKLEKVGTAICTVFTDIWVKGEVLEETRLSQEIIQFMQNRSTP